MQVFINLKNFKARDEFTLPMLKAIESWEKSRQYNVNQFCNLSVTACETYFDFCFEFKNEYDGQKTNQKNFIQKSNLQMQKIDMIGMPRDWMLFVITVYMDFFTANNFESISRITHDYICESLAS